MRRMKIKVRESGKGKKCSCSGTNIPNLFSCTVPEPVLLVLALSVS